MALGGGPVWVVCHRGHASGRYRDPITHNRWANSLTHITSGHLNTLTTNDQSPPPYTILNYYSQYIRSILPPKTIAAISHASLLLHTPPSLECDFPEKVYCNPAFFKILSSFSSLRCCVSYIWRSTLYERLSIVIHFTLRKKAPLYCVVNLLSSFPYKFFLLVLYVYWFTWWWLKFNLQWKYLCYTNAAGYLTHP